MIQLPAARLASHPSFCRICAAHCPLLVDVDVEGGRAVRVRGDRDAPYFGGYTCAKGRALPDFHNHPRRLLHSLRRGDGGDLAPIRSEDAIREVAERLSLLIDEHGPNAVALYTGTAAFQSFSTSAVAAAWLKAIGSSMGFSTGTIDQPGKLLAPAFHGRWLGGAHDFDEADTWLLVGTNPTVSKLGGIPVTNPSRHLHQALARGLDLIVIDPRRSEAARKARLHLQPRPGEDPSIIAGLIRVVLAEGLCDDEFIRDDACGIDELRVQVAPFTPEYVAERAGVPADDIVEAARLFAHAKRGSAIAGTGPNMAPHGTLTEYLLLCLNTLCGRWRRAGERVANPGVLANLPPWKAQAAPPYPAFGLEPKLRVRDLGNTACGLPTAALAEEILLEGSGQIRALVCVGGNPMMAFPDQARVDEALQKLDLLVVLEPQRTATTRYADFVIAPKLTLETPAITIQTEGTGPMGIGWGFPVPWAQYTAAVTDPPVESDVLEDWQFFYRLAREMGVALRVACGSGMWRPGDPRPPRAFLDMEAEPTSDELLEILTQASPVPLAEIRRHPRGGLFERDVRVAPRDSDCEVRLELADPLMMRELSEVARESIPVESGELPFRLVSRRIPNIMNSSGREIAGLTRHGAHNPAYMNPEDLVELEIAEGAIIEISSGHATILGVAEAEADLRRGVISMAHGFGEAPGYDGDVRALGSNTGRLTNSTFDFERYTGMPRMSAIPVGVRRFG